MAVLGSMNSCATPSRVLHVTHQSWPYVRGGVVRLTQVLVACRAAGVNSSVVSSPYQRASSPGLERELSPEGFLHYRTNSGGGGDDEWGAERSLLSRVRRSAQLIKFAVAVFRIARKERPDFIHAHQTFVEVLASLPAAKLLGIPLIYDVRSAWEMEIKSKNALLRRAQSQFAYALERIAVLVADRVVAICEGLVSHYKMSPDKVSVIYNTSIGSWKKCNLHSSGRMRLLYAGAITDYEGLDFLIRSIRSRDDFDLTIVGSGDYDALRSLSESLGLTDRVHVSGPVPRGDAQRMMEAADAIVLPRMKRPITDVVVGLKPIEALAAGMPVIASDVGGHLEVLADGENAFLFEAGSEASLNFALDRFKAASVESRAKMQIAAIGAFENRFSMPAFVQRYLDAYSATT